MKKYLIQPEVRRWIVLIAIGVGTFMSALDGSVVNTILPVLRERFSSSVAEVEWIVTIYLLIVSSLLLGVGRLGDLQGHKKVYLVGFGIFTISSLLCSLANSISMLVFFRGLQALGAAMLQANSPAILTSSFPAQQRGKALGLQATMTYLGLTVGPSIGGWLTDQFGWHSVFLINIPFGLIAIALSAIFIQKDDRQLERRSFDFLGAGVFIFGLVALLYGLNQGHALGWGSFQILIILFAAAASLIVFLIIEKRSFSPMLDLHLFSNSIFSTSVVSAIFNYIGVYTITFLMPFYLIQGRGYSVAEAGLILTVMPLTMAFIAPIMGIISDRIGTRFPAFFGMTILTFGQLLLTKVGPYNSIQDLSMRLVISGFGIGTFISPNNSALMGSAPKDRQGIAAGMLATSRNLGMVLGVGFSGAIFTSFLGSQSSSISSSFFQAIQSGFLFSALVTGLGMAIIFIGHRERERVSDK